MDGIDELAASMLARCASHGHSVVEVDDRHAQEALRSELRRLARQWRLRIRTIARDGRVAVARIDQQPWDDDDRAAIQRVDDALGGDDPHSS
jgi:hypothetical protein